MSNIDDQIKPGSELENIFSVIGADSIPLEEKGAILGQILEVIQLRVISRVLDILPEDKCGELSEIIDKEDPMALDEFLNANVPNFTELFEQEAKKKRLELIRDFAAQV